jgi:hypothetical protein
VTAASLLAVACSDTVATAPPAAAFVPRPHSTLAQMMRGIPFPSSNIVFDAQSEDPAKPRKPAEVGAGATATFANVYAGWQQVENSALAVAETANLLMIPGRLCENGRPVPLDRDDFRRFSEELAVAGQAAYKAAQSRDLDAMVEVSGTVSDACAHCHEIYRDKEDPKDRCQP